MSAKCLPVVHQEVAPPTIRRRCLRSTKRFNEISLNAAGEETLIRFIASSSSVFIIFHFPNYAVAEWYGAGLCDREVAGSNPTNVCHVPTPTQRAIPSGRLMSTSESWGVNGHTT